MGLLDHAFCRMTAETLLNLLKLRPETIKNFKINQSILRTVLWLASIGEKPGFYEFGDKSREIYQETRFSKVPSPHS